MKTSAASKRHASANSSCVPRQKPDAERVKLKSAPDKLCAKPQPIARLQIGRAHV